MTTPIDTDKCTYATCSVKEYGQLQYIPTLAGNAAYAGIFGVLLLCQIFLGVRNKTWGFLVGMVCGLALEIIGYIGRIQLHNDVFDKNQFIIYLVGLTIAPAFLSASIYLCLARIIATFGDGLSLLKPRTITLLFIVCDSVSILLQAVGGAITSTADDKSGNQIGVDIMIAGLSSQVVSLVVFMCLCAHFAFMVRKHPERVDSRTWSLRTTLWFHGFLCALATATITILIRSCFRVAELKDGFDGSLANNETIFMILEGPMIITAVLVLTVFHPGLALGSAWKTGGFSLRGKKNGQSPPYKEVGDEDSIRLNQV